MNLFISKRFPTARAAGARASWNITEYVTVQQAELLRHPAILNRFAMAVCLLPLRFHTARATGARACWNITEYLLFVKICV